MRERILRPPTGRLTMSMEAALELARASVGLRLFRLLRRPYAARLLDGNEGTGAGDLSPQAMQTGRHVGLKVAAAASRLPWHPTCLRQAVATRRMLSRRRIPSVIHLGVSNPGEFAAHAWVTVAGYAVVGGAGRHGMTELTSRSAPSASASRARAPAGARPRRTRTRHSRPGR